MTETRDALADLLDRAEAHLVGKRYRDCHSLCLEAVRAEPAHPHPYFLLGVLAAEHGNTVKALELFERAVALNPQPARYHAQLARCLVRAHRHDEALAAAQRASERGPDDAFTLDTIGVVLSLLGRHGEALDYFRRALAYAPDSAEHRYNLAAAQQFAGDFAGAEQSYLTALRIDPQLHRAYSSLVSLRKQSDADVERVETMRRLFESCEGADARLHLGHALAKSCEDMGDYQAALDWLLRAKAAKRAELSYDRSADAASFEAARKLADIPVNAAPAGDRPAPVFVIGLPRTGTTLVDRILSSHSQASSVGELTNFALHLKQAARTASPLVLDADTLLAASDVDLGAVGARYLDSAARLHGGAPFFVDKMPLNFFFAPALLAALTSARIICLKRGAMDACVSNFRQLLAAGFSYYNYALDLEDTARYFAGFERLTSLWRERLPAGRYLEVRYEDLVRAQEETTRRLLTFCGLPWEDACLDFHRNAAPVATASSVQVRQPLYATSIGRWRRYGERVAPARRTLESLGVALE